jgi:hypothetical protein
MGHGDDCLRLRPAANLNARCSSSATWSWRELCPLAMATVSYHCLEAANSFQSSKVSRS